MFIIILQDKTVIEADDIDYIAFEPGGTIVISGWKEGLNQTYDTFPPNSIDIIRHMRNS